jgi:hypothetical protein
MLVAAHGTHFMIWNVRTQKPLGGEWWPGNLNGNIQSLAYSGDGTILALALDNNQTLLLRDSRQLCESFSAAGSLVAISSKSNLLVMGNWEGAIRFKYLQDKLAEPRGPIERRGPPRREILPPPSERPQDEKRERLLRRP